jgi:hypothetical protein
VCVVVCLVACAFFRVHVHGMLHNVMFGVLTARCLDVSLADGGCI